MPQVEEFKYLGFLFTIEGKMEWEVSSPTWRTVGLFNWFRIQITMTTV